LLFSLDGKGLSDFEKFIFELRAHIFGVFIGFFCLFVVVVVLWDWGSNSELHTCKTGTLSLEPHLQSSYICFES
jgi:hypothetical protein